MPGFFVTVTPESVRHTAKNKHMDEFENDIEQLMDSVAALAAVGCLGALRIKIDQLQSAVDAMPCGALRDEAKMVLRNARRKYKSKVATVGDNVMVARVIEHTIH